MAKGAEVRWYKVYSMDIKKPLRKEKPGRQKTMPDSTYSVFGGCLDDSREEVERTPPDQDLGK